MLLTKVIFTYIIGPRSLDRQVNFGLKYIKSYICLCGGLTVRVFAYYHKDVVTSEAESINLLGSFFN